MHSLIFFDGLERRDEDGDGRIRRVRAAAKGGRGVGRDACQNAVRGMQGNAGGYIYI